MSVQHPSSADLERAAFTDPLQDDQQLPASATVRSGTFGSSASAQERPSQHVINEFITQLLVVTKHKSSQLH